FCGRWPLAHRSKLVLPMPPMMASLDWSFATSRRVISDRFITLAALRATAFFSDEVMNAPLLLGRVALLGEQRGKDDGRRFQRGERLLDHAIDDELHVVEAFDRKVLDAQRGQHGPHGAANDG